MRKTEAKKFKDQLVTRHKELTTEFVRNRSKGLNRSADGIEDYVDYAVSSYTKEFLLSLSDLERKQLHLIEDALNRLSGGNYGMCQACGKDVSKKRLEAVPWARHCIECQELEEQGLLPSFHFGTSETEDEEDEG